MFTPEYRAQLRSGLLEYAANDKRITGAALTGSAAAGREDRWSDIDLAFGVADIQQVAGAVADLTAFLYDRHAALHHHDMRFGDWLYRVFFLPGTLQVDLAFVPQTEFRPLGPTFKLIFGEAKPLQPFPAQAPVEIIGLAWLHALHARSSILRAKYWQAEYMISAVRNHVMALACMRHGLSPEHGRGMDLLPASVTAPLAGSLVRELDADHLWLALGVAVRGLVAEISQSNAELGARLETELTAISNSPGA